jgi:Ca2+-binding RTX toxin-like protein
MMGQQQMTTTVMKRTLVLLAAMLAALMAASGVAFAVSKACPTGTTQQNPCSGTSGIDTLIGTSGPDYIRGLAGNDKISGGAGDDTTDGGGGNDTYSYGYGWGLDTLIDSGGSADHLNFSAAGNAGLFAIVIPEKAGSSVVQASGPGGTYHEITFPSGAAIEQVTGSADDGDYIVTGGAANTLRPGRGAGGAFLGDLGGGNFGDVSIPASSDTYTGFSASGYGEVDIEDHGGTADKLVLPFASTEAYFEAVNGDDDAAVDDLIIMTSSTDYIYIFGQLEPNYNRGPGRIEQIVFTDETLTIGSETPQAQTLSGATATTTGGAEEQVAALNEASNLDEAEKEKRLEAAKQAIEEAKQNGQQRGPQGQQHEQQR